MTNDYGPKADYRSTEMCWWWWWWWTNEL